MKKNKWMAIIIGVMMLVESQAIMAQECKVYIDGSELKINQPLIIEKGITYVPVRVISEALGARLFWYEGYVDINVQDIVHAGCEIGSNKAYTVDGEVLLDGEPRITDGTTYVPLRFVGEALGAEVEYKAGNIYIHSKGIEAKINRIKAQIKEQEEQAYESEASQDEHYTHNALYTARGVYDALSNKWIYTVYGKKSSTYVTVIYDIGQDKWSLLDSKSALEQSVYAQYVCPGDREDIINYKDNTLLEDFSYQYKEDCSSALFRITFSEQQAEYYVASGMFKIDFSTGIIECVKKPLEENVIEGEEDYTIWKESITPSENEPDMPDLPSDLDIHKLPIDTLKLQTKYHARLLYNGQSKEVIIAYKMDDNDFVVFKDVQSLVEEIGFIQTSDGQRILSYKGQTIPLTKQDYKVLLTSNKLVISNKILKQLGVNLQVQYF